MADQPNDNSPKSADPAVNVIRAKINALYKDEPDAATEATTVAPSQNSSLSKHQRFMQELSASGKSLAEIQTEWHNYYVKLPDDEKHKVWHEFYEKHAQARSQGPSVESPPEQNAELSRDMPPHEQDGRNVATIKRKIVRDALKNSKVAKNHHVRSIVFGLGMGAIVMLFLLFGFFNERFIAPFITPSRSVSSTPIIIDPDSSTVSKDPKIIIPKINVEIPVVYGAPTKEDAIQDNLEKGVVHMSNTAKPGELGNAAIVGHSSNNIFNQGKYKFAFVLLSKLEEGDTFYINRGGTRYVYKVYEKKIVKPSDVSVLADQDKPATVTLITCDPPGTSLNRLIVVGEQISPDPGKNAKSSAEDVEESPELVPGNAESLWQRIVNTFTN